MTTPATVETVEKPVEDKHAGLSHLSEEDRSAILALREEAAERRIKAKSAMAELEKLKTEKQEMEEAKMKEQGMLKELLEKKENELKSYSSIKDEHTAMRDYFNSKLEEKIKELPEVQRELIMSNDKMNVAQKLDWTEKLLKEVNGLKPIPESVRPGGKAPDEKINMEDYSGPEGRRKLVNLSKTNPVLFEAIVKQKNIS
jgi:hypothetical protein